MVNIFNFAGQTFSLVATQLCWCSMKAAIGNMSANRYSCVPVRYYLQKEAMPAFGPWGICGVWTPGLWEMLHIHGLCVVKVTVDFHWVKFSLRDTSCSEYSVFFTGRSAFIGIGFTDRGDAFDFNVSLQDHFKWVILFFVTKLKGFGNAPSQLNGYHLFYLLVSLFDKLVCYELESSSSLFPYIIFVSVLSSP